MRTPHFKEIQEHWKEPLGPYRKAPPEYGGEWWMVTPFSSLKPWLYYNRKPEKDLLPEGFVVLFGDRPQWKDFIKLKGGYQAFRIATVEWEKELKYFKGTGVPEWATPAQLAAAEKVLIAWNLGRPTFYESRYGWLGRFLDSQITDYDGSAWQIINFPHHFVSQYQIAAFLRGVNPPKWHYFVPPALFSISGSRTEAEHESSDLPPTE